MKTLTIAFASLAAAGLMSIGGKAQAQLTISGTYPNGAYQFQSSGTLSFTAASAAGITNVSVTLNGTQFTTGLALLQLYSTALGGLTISGSSTSQTVSVPLSSNMVYSAVIQITDANGLSVTNTESFDTLAPAYTFEAEDYDYGGGLFFDNPQTNAYAGLVSVTNVDFVSYDYGSGLSSYRPQGLETEPCSSDTSRIQYVGTGKTDYDCGYGNRGNLVNYTRHYPAGSYYVYLRGADGNGPDSDTAELSVQSGTASFNNNNGTYRWAVPQTGWNTYIFVQLKDAGGNPAVLTIPNDGTSNRLQVLSVGGDYNANFYMLMPTNANATVVGSATAGNFYPDGTVQMQQTNQFNCTVSSPVGINGGGIVVQLKGTNLLGQVSSTVLSAGNGLTLTGNSSSWNVNFLLTTDTTYSAFIQMTDVNGNSSSTNIVFDTVNPAYYTFEAEDWDFGGGQFVAEPQIDQYIFQDGVNQVDYNCPAYGGQSVSGSYDRYGLNTEGTGDAKRPQYVSPAAQDYDADNVNGGDWANYSRVYPAGVYNVYMRFADGNGGQSDAASVSLVTSGVGTASQTTSKIGTFKTIATGGWGGNSSQWNWAPLLNGAGYPATITFDGVSTNTLRVTTDSGSYNANYYMLVPATITKIPPYVSGFTPDGTALFQLTNTMSFTANSSVGIPPGGVQVIVNGMNVSSQLTFSGTPNALTVNCPLQSNTVYSVIVTLTDSFAASSSTNSFDTLATNTFCFEAEDYDYTTNGIAGQFFDNMIDAYNGLPSTENVDEHDGGNGGNSYRPSGTGIPGLEIETSGQYAGDYPRPAYVAGSYTDYRVGFNNGGNWANYTRTYPAGKYNIYMRSADVNAQPSQVDAASLYLVTAGFGTTSQTTTKLGTFTVPYSGGWGDNHTFGWAPLLDVNGNVAQVTFTGTTNTLRVAVDNGNYNVNFYALVPVNQTIPVINNLYPNGSSLFQSANSLAFGVTSSAGISTNAIVVTINGVVATNVMFSGSSTSWNVNAPLQTNSTYTAIITVTSLNGNTVSVTNSFDTFSAAGYQWEAEDYDYNGGQFIDNPQVDGYTGFGSVAGIDNGQTDLNTGRAFPYRANTTQNPAPGTATAGDLARSQFTGSGVDYNIGFFGGSSASWCNYTRHYPPGTYNVWARLATGGGTSISALSQVTGGFGTTNQALNQLGIFTIPSLGWGTWQWAQLVDGNGNPVKVTLDGSANTLRLSGVQAEVNVNFFTLTPTTPAPVLKAGLQGGNVALSFFAQTNYNYQIQYKTNLTDANWINLNSPVAGNNTNNTVNVPFTGVSRFYRIHP